MFLYPKFNADNIKILSESAGPTHEMLQDICIQLLNKNMVKTIGYNSKETAVLLIKGSIQLIYDDQVFNATRADFFKDLPVCIHFSHNTKIKVLALEDSEILIQSTFNNNIFPTEVFHSDKLRCTVSCKDKWENTAVRNVITIIDHYSAPHSNMVLGEVLVPQGRWWSYIPHSHPQPEVYYYKFADIRGFGACFIDDQAYTIKEGSCGLFPGGVTHAQVTAPGYPMYCAWMIRHLDGNKWIDTRIDDPSHKWLL
ncbi:MAG: 5-deoxy-glucuronate isomerase [Christensenellaceae bacterium]|jgi:5-deoxy-glucuronate isomerase|nr:5-deoxy-glucuronate isomerase [Christensenellaceae bacterium]